MPRVILTLLVLALTIACLIDCIQTEDEKVRNLPKLVWIIIILLFPVVAPVAWLFAGRPKREVARPQRPAAPARNIAPDDDPRFLAGLDRANDERRRLAEWEQELKRREDDLRAGGRPPSSGREPDREPGPAPAEGDAGPSGPAGPSGSTGQAGRDETGLDDGSPRR